MDGIIHGNGTYYSDGLERMYLHLRKNDAHGLPIADGSKTAITIVAKGHNYTGQLNARRGYNYLFVSPELTDEEGRRHKLAHLLVEWGLVKGGRVQISVNGTRLTLHLTGDGLKRKSRATGRHASAESPPRESEKIVYPASTEHLSSASPLLTLEAADLIAPPPERIATTVSRIVRDTALAAWVKTQHHMLCQLCGETVRLADGSGYAEAHHIRPLGSPHDGPDVAANILCLCPNHHAACDLGAIRLSVEDIRTIKGHAVARKFVQYHNRNLYRGTKDAERSTPSRGPA